MEMQVLHLHAVVEHLPDLVHLEEMPGNSHWRNWPMRSEKLNTPDLNFYDICITFSNSVPSKNVTYLKFFHIYL